MASLSAREQAYQTIRSRIITMELKPGDPLNDRELAIRWYLQKPPVLSWSDSLHNRWQPPESPLSVWFFLYLLHIR